MVKFFKRVGRSYYNNACVMAGVGVLLLLVSLLTDGLLKDTNYHWIADVLMGGVGVIMVTSCLCVCVLAKDADTTTEKCMLRGCYGLVACVSLEWMVDWLFLHAWGMELPCIFPVYALPLGIAFLGGLFSLMFQDCRPAKKRS